MNFFADLVRIAQAALDRFEVDYAGLRDGRAIMERWADIRTKQIMPAPRNVVKSRRLQAACPAPDFQAVLSRIEAECAQGQDLNHRLNKAFFRAEYTDFLFADWRIYHLHISGAPDGKYFMQPSSHLLFVVFRDANAYWVDIRPRGEDYKSLQKELLTLIHEEWPELLEPYRVQDFNETSAPSFSPSKMNLLRNAGVNIIQRIGNRLYSPIGRGASRDTVSASAIMEMSRLMRYVKSANAFVMRNQNAIVSQIAQKTGKTPASLDLHLEFNGKDFYLLDPQSNCTFRFGQ
ncbi:MAG: hypothetical protein NTX50_02225 [Candidatus Sumerlaeota bacterium]|nr:hypothetical protein [Candidatus Sumerlaeota bacterium]